MQLQPQVSFHHTEPLPDVENLIRNRVAQLNRYCDHITSCRVVVDVPHKHHHSGNLQQIRLDITVPDKELAITREAGEQVACKDLKVAVKEAFDAADRLLEDYVRQRRHDVKHHDNLPHARVRSVEQDHGFLETPDGREIYFHKNSVLNEKFDSLVPGVEVAFVEEAGGAGPQASTVRVVGRHGGV